MLGKFAGNIRIVTGRSRRKVVSSLKKVGKKLKKFRKTQNVKVRPHYAARHTAAKCGKSCAMPQVYVDVASACRSMLHDLKIRSANCRSHQKKPRGI